jgi:glycerate 2-kinase
MTDQRPLLRAIFDAAVAAAHPDVVLSAHLRPVPKGRVICLAAGKAAAAMAAAAERHYLDQLGLAPSRLSGVATTRHGHGVPKMRANVLNRLNFRRGSRWRWDRSKPGSDCRS